MVDWPGRVEIRDDKITSMIVFYATGWIEVSVIEKVGGSGCWETGD